MSKFQATTQQQAIIRSQGKNILVSASAGTGKTRVMIERILHMISQGEKLRHMLVVTFTEKAAMEMRQRLEASLRERYEASGDRVYLQAIGELALANISTLHGFCLKMVRRYAYFINLDQNPVILTELEADFMKEKVRQELLEDCFTEASPTFHEMIRYYGNGYTKTMESWIETTDAFLNAYSENEKFLQDYLEELDCPLEKSILVDNLAAYWLETLGRVQKVYQTNLDELDLLENQDDRKAILQEEIQRLESWKESIEREKIDGINAGKDFKLRRWPSKRKDDPDIIDCIKDDRGLLRGLINNLKKNPLDKDFLQHSREQKKAYIGELYRLAIAYRERYQAMKGEKNAMDFDDMEKYFIRLLDNPAVLEELKEEIRWIFFDEYQDANYVQEEIIERLKAENNLFFVGDVKQSIYAFRGSKPELFLNRMEDYGNLEQSGVFPLSQNFRSEDGILYFVNRIFSGVMNRNRGRIEYDSPEHRFQKILEPNKGTVEMRLLDTTLSPEEETEDRLEAYYIGKMIKEWIEKEEHRYRDIVILKRTNQFEAFEDVFSQMGIPYYSQNETVGFERGEVDLFYNLLHTVENERLDLPLMATLLSFAGGMDEEDLWAIRKANPTVKSFAEAFNRYQTPGQVLEKKEEFLKKLEAWKNRARKLPLSEFLWEFYKISGFRAWLFGKGLGHAGEDRIKAIILSAEEYESVMPYGLYGFLQLSDSIREKEKSHLETPGLSPGQDVVQLMSMHASKGLEFPVVILAGMEKRANFKDFNVDQFYLDRAGAAMPIIYDNQRFKDPEQIILAAVEKKNILEEELRLLYVAMTRAEERLCLIYRGKMDKLTGLAMLSPDRLMDSSDSVGEWVFAYGLKDSAMGLLPPEHSKNIFQGNGPTFFAKELADDEEELLSLKKPKKSAGKSLWKDYLKHRPKKEERGKLMKQTVTKLAHESEKEFALERKPPSFIDDEKWTPMEKGILVHLAFQYLPFDGTPVKDYLDGLVKRELLTLEERQIIPDVLVESFLDSPLGQEIAKASYRKQELSFTMLQEDYLVDGQVDLVFNRGDDLVLVDFKTDGRIRPGFYDKQLQLYGEALEKATGKKIQEKIIYWIFKESMTKIP